MSNNKWYIGLGIILLLMVSFTNVANTSTPSDNLLSNDFINDWTGTNEHFHGANVLAGVHDEYREQTITLSDHMDTIDIQGITSSEFSAEVWFWNQNSQSVDLIQEITDSTGKEYSNTITMSGSCSTWNGCSYQDSPTNTIIITDVANDYDITTRFSFSVPSQPNYHYGADIRNPSLILYYEPFKVDVETFSDAELWLKDFEKKYEAEFKDTEFIFRDAFKEEEVKLNDYYMFEEDMYMFMEEPKDDMKEEEIKEEKLEEPTTDDVEEFIEEYKEDIPEEFSEEMFMEEPKEDIDTDEPQTGEVKVMLAEVMNDDQVKISVMLKDQPLMQDVAFYEPINIYADQITIFDNRQIYGNITYVANDPLTTYFTLQEGNQEQQQKLKTKLESMTWRN